jgi:streptogramin lyase
VRLARVLRETTAERTSIALVVGSETVRRIVEPLLPTASPAATFQEWSVPQGFFPDQIDIDSAGIVWFSQPNQDWVTSFDPATEVFTQHDTTGGDAPDGLMVDSNDVLWTGLYDAGGLGKLDIAGSIFTAIPVPYPQAHAAIPNETTAGTVWLTDHLNNRISEFDPGSGTWLQSLLMPTPDCWVVGGTEDPASLDVYFTEYNAHQLGRKIFGGPIVDIDAPPNTGPAFAAHAGGFIYFSEWSQARLGAYEIASGDITEYAFPVAGENGGPIDATPGGLIAVGTRNAGYIMVFDPADTSFEAYPIPSPLSGLKDGLRTDGNGSIWFTESGSANKIAVLHPGAGPPSAQFSGSPTAGAAPLAVTFTDLSTSAPTSWSWSFGDGGTSSLPSPTHAYTDPGLYTVSLTVGNEIGVDTETKVDYIHVIPGCPLSPSDPSIAGKRLNQDVVFTWDAHADCQWAVHRASVPQDILATPPIETVTLPLYREHLTPEPLVFYNIAPTDKEP